ncbi:MAG: anaerobic ribonucleoside-triphosphate reductase activating protein [Mycoplasmataceae bacterium]|nr:anaerobic ribonucleoside-triphosphate reductase activating protein [Mycoplasmataceae bacterium]
MVTKIRLAGIAQQSTVNGQGLRKVFFSQGCSHHCKNCFNPETWSFAGGQEFNIGDLVEQVVKEKYLTGVTFSGGDPFQQAEAFAKLAILLKQQRINIWSYTGYTYEELLILAKTNSYVKQMLDNIDVIIDGKYIEKLANDKLKYRGSSNQRIIDVAQSLKIKKIKLLLG